jgi:hypothetical protein
MSLKADLDAFRAGFRAKLSPGVRNGHGLECASGATTHSGSIARLLSHLPARQRHIYISLRKESIHEQHGKRFFSPVT